MSVTTLLCHSLFICSSVLIALLSIVMYYFSQLDSPAYLDPSIVNINTHLDQMDKLDITPFSGCESIVSFNGSLYTGVVEGKILKVDDTRVRIFTQLGKPNCTSYECGRPLGIRLSHDQHSLYVADAYLGLFKVSLSTGIATLLFPFEKEFKVTFFNDIDLISNDTIIVSESSVRHSLHDLLHVIFEENPTGRLLIINTTTGEWRVLIDGLRFANGVQLHSDANSVLVAESGAYRIMRVPLDGSPATVFADKLVGYPDNIRPSPRGGYWVPVINLRTSFMGKILNLPMKYPWMRWFILKISNLNFMRNLKLIKSTILLRLDETGRVVEAINDPSNSATNVAEVCELDNALFTGSYYLPYIGRLRLAP